MKSILNTQVIIVGAGPTGLSLALQLQRYGIDFVIIDRKAGVTPFSKAMVLQARSLEIYDQLGLAWPAVADGEILQKASILNAGKTIGQLDFSDFGGELSPFPYVLVYEQSKNEQLLYSKLQAGGQEVLWNTELVGLSQDDDTVSAVLQSEAGESQALEASYLVGCDGAGSPTRNFLKLPFLGSTDPRQFYVADVDMSFQASPATFYVNLGANAFVLMFPMHERRHWRLIGSLPETAESTGQPPSFEQIQQTVRDLVQRPLEIHCLRWYSSYKVHTRHAEPFYKGRCFLAGDAAHVHTPAGGQGMNTGIQDAYNLAWKLAFVLRGDATSELLETYNEERLANAKRLLQSTDQFFEVAASNRWYFRFLRENIVPVLANIITRFKVTREFIFQLVSEIDIHYQGHRLSQSLNSSEFEVKAGDRMPYFLLNEVNIYWRLSLPKFHLMVFSNNPEAHYELHNLAERITEGYGQQMDLNIIPLTLEVTEIFGSIEPFKLLLRPDNYIALISSNLALDEVQNYFENCIFPPTKPAAN